LILKQIIDVRPRTCLRFGFTLRFPSVVVAFLTFSFLFHPASYYFLFCTAVKSIKKQQLVEIRTMANPPAVVKLALESICLLLGENASDWKSIRAVIMRDNFINTVVNNFNTEDIRYACASYETEAISDNHRTTESLLRLVRTVLSVL
jgi:hypothetical protein